jgi:hypothetical protein
MMTLVSVLFLTIVQGITPFSAYGLGKSESWHLYQDGSSSFRQANELVTTNPQNAKELYRRALLAFERIVREGKIENGKLYYNIGNIYFRLGDIGRAILYYRRAEKWIPNDANLQQNLGYARSRRIDRIEKKSQTQILRTLFFWHYDLSRFTRAAFFAAFFNIIWICGAIYLFKKKAWLRYTMIMGAVVSLLLAASLGVDAFEESRVRSGVILDEEVIARKGDSTTYQPSFKDPLHAGTEFILVEERKGWYHIELADGRRCWIPDSAADLD